MTQVTDQLPAAAGATETAAVARAPLLPAGLGLTLLARRPPKLPEVTVRWAAEAPVPEGYDLSAGRHPAASVVVVTHNNLAFTKLCVAGLFAAADPQTPFELIIVDNASSDGTADYLRALADGNGGVRVVFNDANRGFAPANNAGLAAAAGDALVLLNNDTVVSPRWLPRLLKHACDPAVGLAGPVTNRIGNEAEVEAAYRTYGEMLALAEGRARRHEGHAFDIPMPAMFCLAMRRDVYEKVGPLDERFEVGMLEDDDYARRARDAGYRLVCAEDVFVHHFGQASFGRLVPTGEYMRLLEANQRRYQEKWGEPWKPYGRRADPRYEAMLAGIRDALANAVPDRARVLVVSKGDDRLLEAAGPSAQHFPQAADGGYSGYYPADAAEAIAHVERLRAEGAEFIAFPETARWWLDHYEPLATHLRGRYRVIVDSPDACIAYDLGAPHAAPGGRVGA